MAEEDYELERLDVLVEAAWTDSFSLSSLQGRGETGRRILRSLYDDGLIYFFRTDPSMSLAEAAESSLPADEVKVLLDAALWWEQSNIEFYATDAGREFARNIEPSTYDRLHNYLIEHGRLIAPPRPDASP